MSSMMLDAEDSIPQEIHNKKTRFFGGGTTSITKARLYELHRKFYYWPIILCFIIFSIISILFILLGEFIHDPNEFIIPSKCKLLNTLKCKEETNYNFNYNIQLSKFHKFTNSFSLLFKRSIDDSKDIYCYYEVSMNDGSTKDSINAIKQSTLGSIVDCYLNSDDKQHISFFKIESLIKYALLVTGVVLLSVSAFCSTTIFILYFPLKKAYDRYQVKRRSGALAKGATPPAPFLNPSSSLLGTVSTSMADEGNNIASAYINEEEVFDVAPTIYYQQDSFKNNDDKELLLKDNNL
ncbi:hypothetical protein ABK040_014121 [Willaertia magna]